MHVEIHDGHLRQAVLRQGMGGGDGHVVEDAETHGLVPGGVVTRGTASDEGVCHLAPQYPVHRHDGAAGGMVGGIQGVRIHDGVVVQFLHPLIG